MTMNNEMSVVFMTSNERTKFSLQTPFLTNVCRFSVCTNESQ